jgi:hypothetical protein
MASDIVVFLLAVVVARGRPAYVARDEIVESFTRGFPFALPPFLLMKVVTFGLREGGTLRPTWGEVLLRDISESGHQHS